MGFIVALDGPAGSGKGTITRKISERTNLTNIDTGAMYRSITLLMLRQNVQLEELDKIKEILKKADIKFANENGEQKVYLNGEDVSLEIRSKEVNEFVSPVSTIRIVREELTNLQRKIPETVDVIMEGRDIGTNVFPNADVKIYLDATPEERAKRRFKQNEEKGIHIPYEEILKNVKERDYRDSHREISPLKIAEDAIYIDTTNLSIEEIVDKLYKIIKEKMKKKEQ